MKTIVTKWFQQQHTFETDFESTWAFTLKQLFASDSLNVSEQETIISCIILDFVLGIFQ